MDAGTRLSGLEELLEVEVRQATGHGFQTDETIDIGGHDRPIQAVGALYIGAGGHRGAAFWILRRRAETRAR